MFSEEVQPILTIISLLFAEEETTNVTKATIVFLHTMMQPDIVFYIPFFLAEFIKFKLNHFLLTSYILFHVSLSFFVCSCR